MYDDDGPESVEPSARIDHTGVDGQLNFQIGSVISNMRPDDIAKQSIISAEGQ
jgi:hypothetical protein